MNVIFLDVDGVLNSDRSFIAGFEKTKQYRSNPDNLDDEHFINKVTIFSIDSVAVNLINRVCDICSAKLVISSTHRKHFRDTEDKLIRMQEYFESFGIQREYVIGWTKSLYRIRGIEIKDWLDDHPEVSNYAIVDDDSDMLPEQLPFFVHCDRRVGISADNYIKLLTLFKTDESYD